MFLLLSWAVLEPIGLTSMQRQRGYKKPPKNPNNYNQPNNKNPHKQTTKKKATPKILNQTKNIILGFFSGAIFLLTLVGNKGERIK